MRVHVLKPVRVDRLGLVRKGRIVELHPSVARTFVRSGSVEYYETKVVREAPLAGAAGREVTLSASPAGQASPQTNANSSGNGGKRKRKKKGELSL